MNHIAKTLGLTVLLFTIGQARAQQPATPPASAAPPATHLNSIRGCLDGERGNYILVEDQSGMVFALKGVGNKLDSHLRQEVEVKGRMLSGTVKTGIRPEKLGSNPSDTVHGIDGVPFQVSDIANLQVISKHCKAADEE